MRKYFYLLWSLCFFGCTEDASLPTDLPILKTMAPADVNSTGATLALEVVSTGTPAPSAYGFALGFVDPRQHITERIVLGKDLQPGLHALRVDSSLVKGVTYFMRAFATYGDKTSYGNLISFKAEGSLKRAWSLEIQDLKLNTNYFPYGIEDAENGYVLINNDHHLYSRETKAFTRINSTAPSTSSGNIIASTAVGSTIYVFNNASRKLHKFSNNIWSIETDLPSALFISPLTHAQIHYHSQKVYVVTPTHTYAYHTTTGTWEQKRSVPKAGIASINGASGDGKLYLIFADKTVWAYNVLSDTWSEKSNYTGKVGNDTRVRAFYLNGTLYAGLGMNTTPGDRWFDHGFWALDIAKNQWKQLDSFPSFYFLPANAFSYTAKGNFYFGIIKGTNVYSLFMFDPTLVP